MCQQVIQTLERDLTFCICLHVYFTDLDLGQRDGEACDMGLWKESNGGFSVVQRLTQKLVWNSESFVYLYVCSGCSTASLSVCLAVYLSIPQSSAGKGMQYKHSHRWVRLCPLYSLLVLRCCVSVCICMCLCVCKTDCTPPQCSQWPPRPSAPLCIVLFLPSVEVKKKKKSTDLALGPFCDSGLRFTGREMMKMEPTPLSFCMYMCVETLRLHLPGSLCSQLAEQDAL